MIARRSGVLVLATIAAGFGADAGRVLGELERYGLARSTLVVYMGDNGFMLGERGLIDKRNAYEEPMRIPMVAWKDATGGMRVPIRRGDWQAAERKEP